jgi:hypothetical protein
MSENKFHLDLVIENSGFLPSYTSQQSKIKQATRPVRVELLLPEGAVLKSGKHREELGHLEGRSNKLDVAAIFAESATDNRARLDWVIEAQPGTKITIKVFSERAGKINREVILK